jgi:tetratricopeptide (TPR) repeat protein
LNPNYAQAFNNRGIAYGKKADHDRAIRDYDRAIALFPEYADAYYNSGTAYNDKRYYDHAILDFDRAVKLNPNFARALYARGTAKLKKGDTIGGNADIAAANAITPDITRSAKRH